MSRISDPYSRVVNTVVALCAIAVTALVVRREFFAPPQFALRNNEVAPELVDDWEAVASQGHALTPAGGALTIVVFSDFECPACGNLSREVLPQLIREHPAQISVRYRHWPLTSIHRFALPAARASECAGAQGRFREFHDAIFAQQDQLGLKTFLEFAGEAGVADLPKFDACARDTSRVEAIQRDIQAAEQLGGRGTPTVVVNGWVFRGGIGAVTLDSIARAVLGDPVAVATHGPGA